MNTLFLIHGVNWTPTSAGVGLLHTLAEKLQEKGEFVRMSKCRQKPDSKVELFDQDRDIKEGTKIVLVEPEIFGGQQTWADLTVRWLLNVPGKAGVDQTKTWGATDAIFHLCKEFVVQGSMPLSFGMVDHGVFNNLDNPDDKNRKLDGYFARKARYFTGEKFPCPEGWLDLSNTTYSKEELAQIFRKMRKLTVLDLTACSVEALLCGAQHEFIPSKYLPIRPVEDYLAWHEEMEQKSEERLEKFMDYCHFRVGTKVYA